jgi:hypothetical protein
LFAKDLPVEQIVVQTAHAGIELARKGLIPQHLDHPHLVVVGIDHEQKLHRTLEKIRGLGVECVPFIEPDRDNQLTGFCHGTDFRGPSAPVPSLQLSPVA